MIFSGETLALAINAFFSVLTIIGHYGQATYTVINAFATALADNDRIQGPTTLID